MASRVGGLDGTSFGIASVFTEEQHRGHRYASRLVDDVAAQLLLRTGAQAVALYSDVPPVVYERAGFTLRATHEWTVPAAPSPPPAGLLVDDGLDVPQQWVAPGFVFSFRPSAAQLDWHLHRERFYATVRNRRAPARHRLRLGDSTVVVAADLKNGVLIALLADFTPSVVEMRVTAMPDVEPLLRAFGDLAWQLGLSHGKLWAPDHAACPSFVTATPCESLLPMIHPSGRDSSRPFLHGAHRHPNSPLRGLNSRRIRVWYWQCWRLWTCSFSFVCGAAVGAGDGPVEAL